MERKPQKEVWIASIFTNYGGDNSKDILFVLSIEG